MFKVRRRPRLNTSYKWCPKCGKRNPSHRNFCSVCATPLNQKMVATSDYKNK